MKAMVLCGVLTTLLIAGADGAYAKGCIKGAAVGGIAGHYAGHHALAGAAAGCVIGHHEAKKHEREHMNSENSPAR
jgi:outer membrane lipoprotein SlyB